MSPFSNTVTNDHKFSGFKKSNLLYYSSIGQKLVWVFLEENQGIIRLRLLEESLGEDQSPAYLSCWQNSVPAGVGPRSLLPCRPSAGGHSLLLEAPAPPGSEPASAVFRISNDESRASHALLL